MVTLIEKKSRRMIIFIETVEEQRNALQLYDKDPELFIYAEKEDFLILETKLKKTIKNNSAKVLFLRRGCNYTFSKFSESMEIIR